MGVLWQVCDRCIFVMTALKCMCLCCSVYVSWLTLRCDVWCCIVKRRPLVARNTLGFAPPLGIAFKASRL